MSKKDEFLKLAVQYGLDPVSMAAPREGRYLGFFTKTLNEHPDLRKTFREAVAEAKEIPVEEQAAAGLAGLFSGIP